MALRSVVYLCTLLTFFCLQAKSQAGIYSYNSIIITEIMARPTASSGLPNSEYAEIFNPGTERINLKNFSFADATRSVPLPEIIIEPGEYLLLIPRTRLADWAAYPRQKLIDLSPWPTLNVGGDDLSIRGPSNELVFFISYSDTWYRDAFKALGGYSLEMIDTNFPCVERENWRGSDHPKGGSPLAENASKANNPDILGPQLLRASLSDAKTLRLLFDEKLDRISALSATYTIEPLILIDEVLIIEPQLQQIELKLAKDAELGVNYSLQIKDLTDCSGNTIREQANKAEFGIPLEVEPGDVVINEILPNPRTGGVKFVEIYNKSNKLLSIKDWKLANLSNDAPANLRNLSTEHILLKAGQYLVISDNSTILKREYPKAIVENLHQISSLPSYPQASGNVLLIDHRNRLLDKVAYSEKMHHPLVKDFKGVSLERISAHAPSDQSDNWLSASSAEGMATPGYTNSQKRRPEFGQNTFTIEPKVFAPDGPGNQTFCTIAYSFDRPGNLVNITVFDVAGRRVRLLAQNALLGTEGFFVWDGTTDNGMKLRMGYYILHFEVYNTDGKWSKSKQTVVIGNRLN